MRQGLAAISVLLVSLYLLVSIAQDEPPFPIETTGASDEPDEPIGKTDPPAPARQPERGWWTWEGWSLPRAEPQPEPQPEPEPAPETNETPSEPVPTEPTDDTMPPAPEPTPEPAPDPSPEPSTNETPA